jgi:hypothetical protein
MIFYYFFLSVLCVAFFCLLRILLFAPLVQQRRDQLRVMPFPMEFPRNDSWSLFHFLSHLFLRVAGPALGTPRTAESPNPIANDMVDIYLEEGKENNDREDDTMSSWSGHSIETPPTMSCRMD